MDYVMMREPFDVYEKAAFVSCRVMVIMAAAGPVGLAASGTGP
jgi:hypothetical protein